MKDMTVSLVSFMIILERGSAPFKTKGDEMAFTLKQISGYLKNMGIKLSHEDDEKIVFAATSGENNLAYYLRAKENGDIFDMQMQILNDDMSHLQVKDHKHLNVLLPQLLYFNYGTKFGSWEYDPSDGDIRLVVEIPLEDAKMTEKQFTRIMSMMAGTSDEYVGKIKNILKTGKVPQSEPGEPEDMRELLSSLFPSFEELFEESVKEQSGIKAQSSKSKKTPAKPKKASSRAKKEPQDDNDGI